MKKCVVIIPALNEEKTIATVLKAIPGTLFNNSVVLEKLVVDDGSTDNTSNIAIEHGAIVVKHKEPQGVGSAFWDGICEALRRKADYAVNIDADGQMDPKDIEKLLTPIVNDEADFVTASRFMNREYYPQMPKIKFWGNQQVAKIVSSITGKKFYDVACGYRAYNKETLLRLNLTGKFTYTQETFLNLANKSRIRIMEIPIKIRGEREFGKSRVASNVLKYAIKSGRIILRAFKDYKPIKFWGCLSLLCGSIGLVFETIFLLHFLMTGFFRGYLWAGLTGAFFALVALVLLVIMIVSDALSKIIINQEEILYYNKKREYYGSEK